MPTKQNRDSTSIGEVLSGFILHMEKRSLGKVDGQKRIRLQSYENYKSYDKALAALSVLSKPLGFCGFLACLPKSNKHKEFLRLLSDMQENLKESEGTW